MRRGLIYIMAAIVSGTCAAAEVRMQPVPTGVKRLDVNLTQNRYLGEPAAVRQGDSYTYLSGGLDLEPHTQALNFKLNPVAEGALEGRNEFYFGVPELYLSSRQIAPGFDFTVGRQKRHWSRLDEEFNLGVWQPQLRWDYLQPKQEGLIGVFLDWQFSPKVHLSMLTSPLFLPDQGPNFQLQGGQFTSGSRWFRAPQSRVALFQGTPFAKDAPLNFELDRPAEEKVIMHPALGLGLHFDGEKGWYTDLNYAYKPRNQIHLGIECANCARLGGAAPVEITAVVHPVVIMHNVGTFETGFKRSEDAGWISLSYDKPNASGLPADYEEAPLDSMMIAGLSYAHFLPPVLLPASWLKFSYMQAFTVQKTDQRGLIDSDQVSSSLDRYPFKELAAVDWHMLIDHSRKNQWDLGFRYSYSIPEKGGWLSVETGFALGDYSVLVGADVIGAGVDPSSGDAGLFSRYRNNDRVYAGVGYVY